MTVIERFREDGEPVRRFFLVAEVTCADRPAEDPPQSNYYHDRDLVDAVSAWMSEALEDRSDRPAVTFHQVPAAMHPAVQALGRGDFPKGA